MRFLVTGANGFVGSALCDELAARSLHYRAVTRNARDGHQFYTCGEINDHTPWLSALEHIDVVVHLAARVHVMRDAAADPLSEFRRTNVEGTMNLARQAVEAGVRRFAQLAALSEDEIRERIGLKPFQGDVASWIEQARTLAGD